MYNAVDSKGLAAAPLTRIVNVIPAGTGPSNQKPEITVLGNVIMQLVVGTPYTDQGATAHDPEDGDITAKIVATGTVDVNTISTYTITYNATDTKNLAADTKTRTVNVILAPVVPPTCTANCSGGGGSTPGPVLTLKGDNPMTVVINTGFTDPGATATDPRDGDITSRIVVTGSVNQNIIGTYTLTYNVKDSLGIAATPVSRVVNVVPTGTTGCTVNCGGGGGGGGGGGSTLTLTITNEKLTASGTNAVLITWNTNLPSDSRVVYGLSPVSVLAAAPAYGYPLTTLTDTNSVYIHSVFVIGIPSGIRTYYRPVSSSGSLLATGIELSRVPDVSSVGGSCEYLKEYLRLGYNNNPTEVTKLQLFLKNYENFTNLAVTGFFDITTDQAVRAFQDKYKTDVLDTWNLPSNTGYVYYTTEKKINEIYCQREFPLNNTQKDEIAAFKALIEKVNAAGASSTITLPVVGATGNGAGAVGQIAGASTVKGSLAPTVTVTPTDSVKAGELGLGAKDTSKDDSKNAVTPEKRGKIALADLLATSPSLAGSIADANADENGDITSGAATETGDESALGAVKSDKKGLMAAVANSITQRLDRYSTTTVFGFTLMLLALVCIALYFTFRNFGTVEETSETTEVTAEVLKK